FIRTGKRMATKQTEVRLVFRHPPRLAFIPANRRRPDPSQVVIKIDPGTGIRLVLDAHRADQPGASEVHLDMEFASEGGEDAIPYEVLPHAAGVGDATPSTRQDSVEESWRVVAPLLDAPPPLHAYAPGSWGPDASDRLTNGFGGWRRPWLAKSA